MVWLLGKVQSGKSSIVRVLTQASDAEIGSGFRACTKTARVFDFPGDAPIIRFLDTRGLGEVGLRPREDIAFCEGRSHLILAVVKAMDLQQQVVLDVIARGAPAPSGLAGRGGADEPARGLSAGRPDTRCPIPYGRRTRPAAAAAASCRRSPTSAACSIRCPGAAAVSFVPIDFTHAGDGFEPSDYGHEALIAALIEAAPLTVAAALAALPQTSDARRKSDAHILGFAAGGRRRRCPARSPASCWCRPCRRAMLHKLAKLHGVQWQTSATMPSSPARSEPAR